MKKTICLLLALFFLLIPLTGCGSSSKKQQEIFANYIFNFIKDGGFYNPSTARVLAAAYEDSDGYYAKTLEADGLLYLKIQGENAFGGTVTREYAVTIGGEYDGEAFSNDSMGKNYKLTDEEIDVPTINKMLIKYWADYGL